MKPQKMPSTAAIESTAGMKRAVASRKKRTAKVKKIVCNALFVLSVPKNMTSVNNPHRKRYAAHAALSGANSGALIGKTIRNTSDSQNSP